MFQIPEYTEARLASVTNRIEKHGDEDKPAITLALEITTANTLLDSIDPTLRQVLYKPVDDQPNLPGVEASTPVLRSNSIDRVLLPTSHEGWTLAVDDGVDESVPMIFGGAKVDKFTVEPKQGGSIVLRLRVGTSDVDAERIGKMGMHNGQLIWVTLVAPKPGQTAIDGTTAAFKKDHPDAGDLLAAGADADVEQDGDDEGAPQDLEDRLDNALDAAEGEMRGVPQPDGSWPFPRKSNNSLEAPPQSVTTESVTRSPTQSRTARGREATKAALKAGAAAAAGGEVA